MRSLHVFGARWIKPLIELCTQGHKRPFATILATQRIAKLHKDAAADLLNVLIVPIIAIKRRNKSNRN